MIHEIIPVGVLQCNCSIFGDEVSHEAVVIDPGDETAKILARLARHNLRVTAIIITHAHIDHIGGAARLKEATGAPVYMNADDQDLYDHLETQAGWLGVPAPTSTTVDVGIRDGDSLSTAGREFQFLHTPGHTQGSVSVWIPAENKLVAGDTLFRDSIGRTDLPGGDFPQILDSTERSMRWSRIARRT